MGVTLRTFNDLSTFVATHIGATSVGLGKGSLVGTRKATIKIWKVVFLIKEHMGFFNFV
jgi:hypothetical protein